MPFAKRAEIAPFDPADEQPFHGWKAGIYDRSKTVSPLSLTDRRWTRLTIPFQPHEFDTDTVQHIRGEAVYGGLLLHHFGHFLLESTSRLWWPLQEGWTGPILFQNTRLSQPLPDFAARFFDLLGLSDRIVLANRSLSCDRVIVPEPSLVIKSHVHDSFRLPFRKAGQAARERTPPLPRRFESAGTGLYLSRTRLPTRRSFGEKRLQRMFVEAGFSVAHLEELTLQQQVALIERHRTIAGIGGSAFHNILFAEGRKTTITICRDYDINPNFFMIDEIMDSDATYIFNMSAADATQPRSDRQIFAAYYDDATLDLPKIGGCLRDHGIFSSTASLAS